MAFEMTYAELRKALTEAHWDLVRAIENSDEWTILSARERFQALRDEASARRIEERWDVENGSNDLR